ncbi:hypothetical protein BR93DRAFT_319298 [Coniochaeta sp. PMI_546]|nr:hypothetical protein BR93DRAFT_319298 [Coniochaeta sp. PMI_546]
MWRWLVGASLPWHRIRTACPDTRRTVRGTGSSHHKHQEWKWKPFLVGFDVHASKKSWAKLPGYPSLHTSWRVSSPLWFRCLDSWSVQDGRKASRGTCPSHSRLLGKPDSQWLREGNLQNCQATFTGNAAVSCKNGRCRLKNVDSLSPGNHDEQQTDQTRESKEEGTKGRKERTDARVSTSRYRYLPFHWLVTLSNNGCMARCMACMRDLHGTDKKKTSAGIRASSRCWTGTTDKKENRANVALIS